jgi:hypothetical protein
MSRGDLRKPAAAPSCDGKTFGAGGLNFTSFKQINRVEDRDEGPASKSEKQLRYNFLRPFLV